MGRIQEFFRNFSNMVRKNGPEVLCGAGIAGMWAAMIIAVKKTPDALKEIDIRKRKLKKKELSKKETAEAVWRCYIWSAVIAGVSTASIIAALRKYAKKNAALAAFAGLAQQEIVTHRESLKELLSDKKREEVLDHIDKERVEKIRSEDLEYIEQAYGGHTLCLDSLTGRLFWSDRSTIEKAANRVNRDMGMMTEPYASLNDFYTEFGLSSIDIGDYLGFNVSKGLIDLRFSSQLVKGNTPCLVISYEYVPESDYKDL